MSCVEWMEWHLCVCAPDLLSVIFVGVDAFVVCLPTPPLAQRGLALGHLSGCPAYCVCVRSIERESVCVCGVSVVCLAAWRWCGCVVGGRSETTELEGERGQRQLYHTVQKKHMGGARVSTASRKHLYDVWGASGGWVLFAAWLLGCLPAPLASLPSRHGEPHKALCPLVDFLLSFL